MSLNIKELSGSLIDDDLGQVEVERILNQIQAYFQQVTGVSFVGLNIIHMAAVPTARGMALSLNHAAQCLLDYKRTVLLIQGMVAAIHDKQQKFPGETINVFYAGCGPYAPMITLIAPLFTPAEVQFSLLEVNASSLEMAQKLISTLGISEYLTDCHLADANTFEIPSPGSVHILFSETLDAVLYRESYVTILWNMLSQLPQDVTLIPENVRLKVNSVMEPTTNQKESVQEQEMGCIFDVRQTLASLNKQTPLPPHFELGPINLGTDDQYKSLIIDTEVHVYKNLFLKRGESSLTLPCEITFERPRKFNTVLFNYNLQPKIELRFFFQ